MPEPKEQQTTGDILGLLQKYDPPDSSPLFAMVPDPTHPEGERELWITDIRLEVYSDGASRMVFHVDDTD